MESASAASSARPPLDCAKTILGSPMTAPSRVKADANRDLIVIVRRTPAGGEPCRDAMDAVYRRLRLGGLLSRPDGQRNDPDRGTAPNRPTSLHSAFAARPQRYYCGRHGRYNVRRPLYGALLSLGPAWR